MSLSPAFDRITLPENRLTDDQRRLRTQELFEVVAATTSEAERDLAIEEVVRLNMRVASAVAQRYGNRGVDLQDLEQTACEALVKAARRFDLSHGRDFLSYAVPTIRGEVQRYFRDKSWAIRPRRTIQEVQSKLNRYIDAFVAEHDREPTDEEVCTALDISRALYVEAVGAFGCFQPRSLNRKVGSETDSMELGELIVDERDDYAASEAAVVAGPLLAKLPPQERRLIHLRFFDNESQSAISAKMGMAQAQVSRRLAQILADMRRDLEGGAPAPATS